MYAQALAASVALLAAGCGDGQSNPSAPSFSKAGAAQATLYGRWRIVAIDGAAPLILEGADRARPHLFFSPSRYGGGTGCNSFGGTGLLVGNRWFGEPPIATQQGCGQFGAQEDKIIDIASRGPVVDFHDPGEATLTTDAGQLRLSREADADPTLPEPEPMLLAGTAWEVGTIDGRQLPEPRGRNPRLLTFEADQWTLSGLCAAMSGDWRQTGQSVTMRITSKRPRDCSPAERPADEALRALISEGATYVAGFNRELVMAGRAHWLTGQFDRSLRRDDGAILRGEWRIDAIDGRAPAASERAPSLIFGKAGYAVWDGCNHTEGVQLTFARQLFTRGSGVSTLQNCLPDALRSRIHGIVGGKPRIAKTGTSGLALVSRAGTLRMTRLSGRSFDTGTQLGLSAPVTMSLLNPNARLELSGASRFAVVLGCGRIEGDWRGGQPARFSPDPVERTAPGCARGPGSDAFRVSQFFTGNVLGVIGPNRDIVLLVNEDESIAGLIAR